MLGIRQYGRFQSSLLLVLSGQRPLFLLDTIFNQLVVLEERFVSVYAGDDEDDRSAPSSSVQIKCCRVDWFQC